MSFSISSIGGAASRGGDLRSISLFALLILGMLVGRRGFAQQKSDFAGDYTGASGPVHVKLHIIVSSDGSITATVDSPDMNIFAVPCSDISINGQTLSFSVPMVRGEWMGTLSADHNTLSGIWKQGAPTPLTFTRNGASPSGSKAAPAPAAQPQVTAKNDGSQHPPCSSTLGVNYWDGAAWKLMTVASHMGGDEGVNWKKGITGSLIPGIHPNVGLTQIVTFKNSAAALTLNPKPSFCVSVPPGFDPSVILIGSLGVKKDHRQLETCTGACAMSAKRSTDDWMPEKHVQPVDIKRLSETTVEITPKEPLKPGQYLLGGPGVLVAYYDFGVSKSSASK